MRQFLSPQKDRKRQRSALGNSHYKCRIDSRDCVHVQSVHAPKWLQGTYEDYLWACSSPSQSCGHLLLHSYHRQLMSSKFTAVTHPPALAVGRCNSQGTYAAIPTHTESVISIFTVQIFSFLFFWSDTIFRVYAKICNMQLVLTEQNAARNSATALNATFWYLFVWQCRDQNDFCTQIEIQEQSLFKLS